MKIEIDKKRKIIKQRLNKYLVRVKIPILISWLKRNFEIFRDLDIWWERYNILNNYNKHRVDEVYEFLDNIVIPTTWCWFLNELLLEAKDVKYYKDNN